MTKNDLYKRISKVYKQTETKRLLLIPGIKRALLKNKFKSCKLLDIGCGTGDFCEMAVTLGYEYYGLDRSESMLSIAKTRHPKGSFKLLSATDFAHKYKTKFHIALLNLVLQDNTKDDEIKIMKETAKCLSKSGLAIVGIHHPCFDHYMRFGLLDKANIKTKFKNYFESGEKYKLKYYYDLYPVDFIDHHVTLQDYFDMFLKSGFEIVAIDECQPNQKFKNVKKKKLKEKSLYPTYMVITLKKR